MNKNRWLITLFVIILGIAIVGIANASTIKNAALFEDQNTVPVQNTNVASGAQSLAPEEKAGLFLEACWLLNKAGIDPLLQKAGITRQDIQDAEKLWAQDTLRQNPNLSIQEMAPMHLAWVMDYVLQNRPQVTVNAVNTAAVAAVQDSQPPAQPPAPAPAPSQQSYQGAPAGHGYHPGHTGQYCTQWPGTGGGYGGHDGGHGGYGMGGHE